MKNVDVKFRTIAYGFEALALGLAALYTSGAIDDIEKKLQSINFSKFNLKKKKKMVLPPVENPVLEQAINNTYYSECFKHGNYKGN